MSRVQVSKMNYGVVTGPARTAISKMNYGVVIDTGTPEAPPAVGRRRQIINS